MKSKYPNQLDTSSEIPVVRDGITEISSEIFNSLRSAIIQIEKTLGINPQGSAGFTVSDRISASLDQSGNLSREALERANVLLGQLTNDNVAANAAIEESKLKLTVPTIVIQSQVSGILNLIDSISSKIEELSASYTVHVSPYATNRHKASSISVASAEFATSELATTSIQSTDLQSTIENIYSSHINFSGQVSEENRSHTAEQIYFDNTVISGITSSANLQNVVEDIATINSEALKDSFSYLNSNGITIFGKKSSSYEGLRQNDICIIPSEVTFIPSGISYTTITFSTPLLPSLEVKPFDILRLEGTSDALDDKDYFIKSILLDGSNKIISVDIFSNLKTESSGFVLASIYKNSYDYNNKNGLNSTVRPRANYTNTPELAICHPNSATIISTGINTSKISEFLSSFKITADEYKELDVNVYNSDINFDEQSIDSIVVKLNEEFISNNFPALAYKLKMPTCYELAISHLIPDLSSDSIKRSLKISAAESQDCTTELGFSNVLDVVHFGKYGNPLHINGVLSKEFYQIDILDSTQINTVISTQRLTLINSTFKDFGTEVGDTVYIYSPANPLDEIVARVKTVSGSNIDLDLTSFSFAGNLNTSSKVFLIKNTIKISDLNFEVVSSSTGYMLVDSLFDRDNRLFYNKRCEVSKYIQNGGLLLTVIDISQGYLVDSQVTLTTNSSGEVFITNQDLVDGEKTLIYSSGEYLIRSPENNGYITVRAVYTSAATTTVTCDIAGFYEHTQDIYHISRFIFGPTLGRIYGFFGTPGIPNIIDKRIFGTVGTKQISSGFIEKYIEQPRHDLRGTGVISGCEISSILKVVIGEDYVTFNVSSGVVVVNGVRFVISAISNYKYYTTSDIYVAINKYGCIEILHPDFFGNAPTSSSSLDYAFLGIINIDGSSFPYLLNNESYFDLRFFIDRVDYKLSKEIIVSTDISEGHFTSISDAIKYAHFYNKIYKTSGTRSSGGPIIRIRDGIFEINEPILINIDLQIVGSGQSTILRRGPDMANAGTIYDEDLVTKINIDLDKVPFVIGGSGFLNTESNIQRGVTFKDFVYETKSEYTGGSAVIAITHNIGRDTTGFYENPPIFRLDSVNFYGPDSLNITAGSEIFEYAVVLTQSSRLTRSIVAGYFGNLIVNSCYFNYMGDEEGIIKTIIPDGAISKVKNIVCVGNIADNMAPNGSSGASIIYNNYSISEVINIIDTNNALND